MSLSLRDVDTNDQRTVSLWIDGGPVLVKQYGKRQYRVEYVAITYRRRNGQPWQATGATLSGPYVKKDGTDGAENNRDRFHLSDLPDMPWLAEFVERYLPGGES